MDVFALAIVLQLQGNGHAVEKSCILQVLLSLFAQPKEHCSKGSGSNR